MLNIEGGGVGIPDKGKRWQMNVDSASTISTYISSVCLQQNPGTRAQCDLHQNLANITSKECVLFRVSVPQGPLS